LGRCGIPLALAFRLRLPVARDDALALIGVKQGIDGGIFEAQRTFGPCPQPLTELIAIARVLVEQVEYEQAKRPFL
jgi:hypothetical protein